MDKTLLVLDIVIRVACWVFALLFIAFYSQVDWRATVFGRHLMQFTRMIAAFLTLVLARILIGPHVWIDWGARLLFAWAAYLLYRRFRMQRESVLKNRDASTPEDKTTNASDSVERENNGIH